jgi:preprotein translocase subunit SecD
MKTKLIIIAVIIASFFIGGCVPKDSVEVQMTIVPDLSTSEASPNSMNRAAEVISKRLNSALGIPLSDLKLDVAGNQISLTISKIESGKTSSIKNVITDYTKLEFLETYENSEIIGSLSKANSYLKDLNPMPDVKDMDERSAFTAQNPLFGILIPRVNAQGEPLSSCMIGLAAGKDTATVNRYLQMPEIKALFPQNIKFLWSQNPYKYDKSQTLYELHAIKITTSDGKAPVDGSMITSAAALNGKSASDTRIRLSMNAEGKAKWATETRENIKRCIAVVLNGHVRSYPVVQNEITGGQTEITGDFTLEEVKELAGILNSGQMPFELKVINEQITR